MAANRQVSAASRRRVRLSGWVLSPFQVTLALCGVAVGFLACFGLGFLSGVWFQTQEQMLPHDDAITLADNQLEREQTAPSGQEMTFYSALPSRDGTPDAVPPSRVTAVSPSPSSSPSPSASEPEAPPPATVSAPAAVSRDAVEPPPEQDQLDTTERFVPPLPSPPVTAEERKPPATAVAALEEKFYSVQVGSFRRVEQAYRLQDDLLKKGYRARIGFSIVEGKGGWYRVRVGRYADRRAANKTAQRLQQKEKIDVLVMRVSS